MKTITAFHYLWSKLPGLKTIQDNSQTAMRDMNNDQVESQPQSFTVYYIQMGST